MATVVPLLESCQDPPAPADGKLVFEGGFVSWSAQRLMAEIPAAGVSLSLDPSTKGALQLSWTWVDAPTGLRGKAQPRRALHVSLRVEGNRRLQLVAVVRDEEDALLEGLPEIQGRGPRVDLEPLLEMIFAARHLGAEFAQLSSSALQAPPRPLDLLAPQPLPAPPAEEGPARHGAEPEKARRKQKQLQSKAKAKTQAKTKTQKPLKTRPWVGGLVLGLPFILFVVVIAVLTIRGHLQSRDEERAAEERLAADEAAERDRCYNAPSHGLLWAGIRRADGEAGRTSEFLVFADTLHIYDGDCFRFGVLDPRRGEVVERRVIQEKGLGSALWVEGMEANVLWIAGRSGRLFAYDVRTGEPLLSEPAAGIPLLDTSSPATLQVDESGWLSMDTSDGNSVRIDPFTGAVVPQRGPHDEPTPSLPEGCLFPGYVSYQYDESDSEYKWVGHDEAQLGIWAARMTMARRLLPTTLHGDELAKAERLLDSIASPGNADLPLLQGQVLLDCEGQLLRLEDPLRFFVIHAETLNVSSPRMLSLISPAKGVLWSHELKHFKGLELVQLLGGSLVLAYAPDYGLEVGRFVALDPESGEVLWQLPPSM